MQPRKPNREKQIREWVLTGARRRQQGEALNGTGRTCHESQYQLTPTPAPPIEAPHPPFPSQSGLAPLPIDPRPQPRRCPLCRAQWRRRERSRQNGTRYAFFVHCDLQFRIRPTLHDAVGRTIRALRACPPPERPSLKLFLFVLGSVCQPRITHLLNFLINIQVHFY